MISTQVPNQVCSSVASRQDPRATRAGFIVDDEEAEYWRDDPFEAVAGQDAAFGAAQDWEDAIITAEQSARGGERGTSVSLSWRACRQLTVWDLLNRVSATRTAPHNRPTASQQQQIAEKHVQYLDDLEPKGRGTSAAPPPPTSVRKQGVKLKPVSSLRASRTPSAVTMSDCV